MFNTLFSDFLGNGVYAYLDDLLICGKDIESHQANLEAVLLKLKKACLKTKLTKCEFLKSKNCLLGLKVAASTWCIIKPPLSRISLDLSPSKKYGLS